MFDHLGLATRLLEVGRVLSTSQRQVIPSLGLGQY